MIGHLNTVPLAGLMLVVTLGFLLGRLEWRGLSLGPAGGTVGVAILLGSWGLSFHELYGTADPHLTVGAFGFALFVYSVGFEAGPRFFASLKGGRGWRFSLIGALVTITALGLAVAGARLLGLGEAVTAGLLAGALTSAPTYAAAVEMCDDRAALAVSFAITFPVGLVGMVLVAQFLPRLMGDDLAASAAADETDEDRGSAGPELRRVFEVQNHEVIGKTLAELALTRRTGSYITRLHRGHQVTLPEASTCLEPGDHVMVQGRLEELHAFEELVGPEVYDHEMRQRMASPRAIRVTSSAVAGNTLAELDLVRRFHCLITQVMRGGEVIEPSASLRLLRDDTVLVVGERADVRRVARYLGRFERSTQETDIAIYAGGILLGLLLGDLPVPGLGLDLRLGKATGLLLVGVLLGRFRRIGPFNAHVPLAARQLVRDLGILLFIAETGVQAGGSSLAGIEGQVLPMILWALLVTAVPVISAVAIGRYLLTLSPVDAWGSVSGGMTSSSSLVVIRRAADSSEPVVSYTASYAVASVLATLAGQIVVLWV